MMAWVFMLQRCIILGVWVGDSLGSRGRLADLSYLLQRSVQLAPC